MRVMGRRQKIRADENQDGALGFFDTRKENVCDRRSRMEDEVSVKGADHHFSRR